MEDPCSYSQLLDFIIDHQSSPDQLTSLDSEMPAVWKAMPITEQPSDQIGSINNGINNQDSIGEFLCIICIFACLIRNYLLFSGDPALTRKNGVRGGNEFRHQVN